MSNAMECYRLKTNQSILFLFKKVDLKRSVNAWVRLRDQDNDLTREEREMRVSHQTDYFFKGDILLELAI